jgi:hypothetical protein
MTIPMRPLRRPLVIETMALLIFGVDWRIVIVALFQIAVVDVRSVFPLVDGVSSIRLNQGLFLTFFEAGFGRGEPGQGAGAFWPEGVLGLAGGSAAWG